MAAGQQLLRMIRNGDFSSGNVPAELNPVTIQVFVGSQGMAKSWESIGSSTGGQVSFDGTGDDLIISSGTIEYTAPDTAAAPYEVGGLRITGTGGEGVFPETTFTDILVEALSTLRFTEIKLTLT